MTDLGGETRPVKVIKGIATPRETRLVMTEKGER